MFKTKKEIAEILGVSISTINKYVKQGMPYYKFTHKLIRFKLEEVYEWVEKYQIVYKINK